ncbi:hypothetical protein [Jiella pelagia]|jgi:hypothetical protein|uniref:Uncharacterized protein n=1 Tax=Jiella pelagia TaxID=2986949 RepID=A0ABY7C148_9HYPH|nr:hypothetical protein [Jiella pelagia]WAP68473.1 hypothetical protein OH818_24705 [Jiella pelagia]
MPMETAMLKALQSLLKRTVSAIRRAAHRVALVIDGVVVGWRPVVAADTFDEPDYTAFNDNDPVSQESRHLAATFRNCHEGHTFVRACRARLDGGIPLFGDLLTEHDKAWIMGADYPDLLRVAEADPMAVYNWAQGSEEAMPGLERPSCRAVRLAEAANVENERHDMQAIMRRVMRRMAAMGHDDPDPDEVERRAYEEIATMRKRRLAAAS